MSELLDVLAGPDALAELRARGLDPARVRVLVGASGGPKWLALHGLDRVLFPWLLEGARAPVHAVGSSIGTWRFACLAAREPLAAIDRFARAYVEEQRYEGRPTPAEVSREAARILDALLGDGGVGPLVTHDRVRLHLVTVRFRHLGALEGRPQVLGLGLAALLNAMHRGALRASLERVVFDARGDRGPFDPWRLLPTRHVALTEENARDALLASAAIPGVMTGVRDPAGAPPGVYRDGGVSDYHFGVEIDPSDGLALYPHFYPHLVPGWFDKRLPWRRTRGLRRVVLIAPSAAWVASLPGGKIPDRTDFERLSTDERVSIWRRVLARGEALGEAFASLVEGGRIAERARPLP
ncbi:MAG TPA: hypothetical protein RMH99_08495 [Sandaracinaceae bacterium LLY-WYZ-13_1]|nr:hypothetical protein [Sandaracinaceae bacterium LLY-WYZ-13_1]